MLLLLCLFVSFLANSILSDDQTYSYWLSGGGIAASCDYAAISLLDYQQLFLWVPPVGKVPLIYIHVDFVKQLSWTIHHFPYAFVLLSGHSDYTNPSEIFDSDHDFNSFVDSKNLVHWFSHNCIVLDHPKISPMPIGLNYHTLTTVKDSYWGNLSTPIEQETEFNLVRRTARPFHERIPKIYGNFHFRDYGSKFGYSRQDVVQTIPAACIDYESTRIKRHDGWSRQTEYAFVVSPHGNGLDCHRTWEALILGCVVIVKSSPLDILYQDLPVIIVQDWNNITVEWLYRAFTEYSGYVMNMGDGVGIKTETRTKQDDGGKREDPLLLDDPSSSSRKDGHMTKKTWVERVEIRRVFKSIFDRLTNSLFGYNFHPIGHGYYDEIQGNGKDRSMEKRSIGDNHHRNDHMGMSVENTSSMGKKRTQRLTEGKSGKSQGGGKRRKWAYEKLTLGYWVALFHAKAAGVA